MLNASALCQRLPHAGKMCLLESVIEWRPERISCLANSHRHTDNPLRNQHGLAAVCGVEYAAQAMALHGALCAKRAHAAEGFLASLRKLRLEVDWLHRIDAELLVQAQRLNADPRGAIYRFRIEANNRELLSGQAMVIIQERGLSV